MKNSNDLAKIFNVITSITTKVKELNETLDPEISLVIADKIKNYYINSDLDPQSLVISYKLFRGIAGILTSKNNITLTEINLLTDATKRYFIDNKSNNKIVQKSLHLYKKLQSDLEKTS